VSNLLLKAFPNLTPPQVDAFVVGLFTTQKNVQDFKTHLRDFLVQLKVRNDNTRTRMDGWIDRQAALLHLDSFVSAHRALEFISCACYFFSLSLIFFV